MSSVFKRAGVINIVILHLDLGPQVLHSEVRAGERGVVRVPQSELWSPHVPHINTGTVQSTTTSTLRYQTRKNKDIDHDNNIGRGVGNVMIPNISI